MKDKQPFYVTAKMNFSQCAGAAIAVSFLMDLFTISGKESFTKEEVVFILDSWAKAELPDGLLDKCKDYGAGRRG